MRHVLGWILIATAGLTSSSCQGGSDTAPPASTSSAPGPSLSPGDQLLLLTSKTALPPSDIRPGDLPEPESREAGLLVTYCSQCHHFPAPTMHGAVDWPGVLRRMWLRMERLPDSLGLRAPELGDRVALVDYLTRHALQVSGATLPPGPGREAFSLTCSRCHALPDLKAHTPQDWPAVFMRMERNMERMGVEAPSQEQSGQILLYLQANGAS